MVHVCNVECVGHREGEQDAQYIPHIQFVFVDVKAFPSKKTAQDSTVE